MGSKKSYVLQIGLAALVSSVLLWASMAAAQNMASGVVFHDANANSARDVGEPGIPGVLVANGIAVVQTDADGRYTLPVTDETIITIVKPAGYKVPVDQDNLPRFYYIHQPTGTPSELNLGYPGIDPTGPLLASIDFPLIPADESNQFKTLMIADPQPQTAAEVDYIRDDFVAQFIGTDAVFGKTHGDIMFDDLSLFPRYNAVMAQVGIPWWNVPGNHEINFPSPNDRYSTETFKRYYGPTYYAHEYGQAVETTRVARTDPFIEELYQRTDDKKPWVNAVLSDHIWEGELPAVAPGAHTLTVYATDEYGREYVQTKVLEVYSTGQAFAAGAGVRATSFSAAASVSTPASISMSDYPIANTDVANRGLLPY